MIKNKKQKDDRKKKIEGQSKSKKMMRKKVENQKQKR